MSNHGFPMGSNSLGHTYPSSANCKLISPYTLILGQDQISLAKVFTLMQLKIKGMASSYGWPQFLVQMPL